MPGLMDLSVELRFQIFHHYFFGLRRCGLRSGQRNDVELRLSEESDGNFLDDERRSDPLPHAREVFRWQVKRSGTYHPLFLTCKQLRDEASEVFRIQLAIFKNIAAVFVKDERGTLMPIQFLESYNRQAYEWDGQAGSLQPAITDDDYRLLVSPWILERVDELSLWSINGLNGDYINREQFPHLKSVVVRALVQTRPPGERGPDLSHRQEMRLKYKTFYNLKEGETPHDVRLCRGGKYNRMFVKQAKALADEHTMQNVPPLDERGFRIFIKIWVEITQLPTKKERAAEMVCVPSEQ